jgi:hypothetical protein
VPIRAEIEGIAVTLFGEDEDAPPPLDAWRSAAPDPSRTFPALVTYLPALAIWPKDIPPPVFGAEPLERMLRRDAVQFVRPGAGTCRSCGNEVEGLLVIGRIWFGGNRRRHKLRRCPECDADFVHSRLLFLDR